MDISHNLFKDGVEIQSLIKTITYKLNSINLREKQSS
jgi:hypothetical protein